MIQIRAIHKAGFEILVECPDLASVDAMISELQRLSYRASASGGDGWQRTPEGLPLCPRHGVAMGKRSRFNDAWHSHRVVPPTGEARWCRGYPTGRADDGYDLG